MWTLKTLENPGFFKYPKNAEAKAPLNRPRFIPLERDDARHFGKRPSATGCVQSLAASPNRSQTRSFTFTRRKDIARLQLPQIAIAVRVAKGLRPIQRTDATRPVLGIDKVVLASYEKDGCPKTPQGTGDRIASSDRIAVCGKTVCTVWREGSRKPMRLSYPYLSLDSKKSQPLRAIALGVEIAASISSDSHALRTSGSAGCLKHAVTLAR